MIKRISEEFRKTSEFYGMTEVKLFQGLAKSIIKHSHSTFIDETHGVKCKVSFHSETGSEERCEISDLLIISVGPDNSLRATFWQAKKEDASKWASITLGNAQFDFDGQFNQWELLATCPQISGVHNKFQPPSDLLSSFYSASIGSIGVFYERGGVIEICHSTAEFIACATPKTNGQDKVRLVINGHLERYWYGQREVMVRTTLERFLSALYSHSVGSLLSPQISAHKWLVKYIMTKSSGIVVDPQVGRALSSFISQADLQLEDVYERPDDGISILLVGQLRDEV